ncbi:MAG TPA: enoyl-CoA hydratase/isomerase family protein [Bacteroidia bacterium]|nr:enoyl-CoA hydratase/isomerase family protein [Bacteroidia bacterium]
MNEQGRVSTEIKNSIAFITFYHPQSNSMPGTLLRELANAITKAGENENAKVIVLQSEGEKTFCAGASFDELVTIHDFETGHYFFSGFASVINAMRKVPKFVIARVQGKAVGGGVGIAAAADYTIAHESASVKLSELAVGIGPFVVGPVVERKIGKAAFMSLTINATAWKDAGWAMNNGLYAEVCSTHEELDKALLALSDRLAKSNPDAMMFLKKIFWEGTEHWDALLSERAAMSGKLVLSDFTKKAIEKFKSKG